MRSVERAAFGLEVQGVHVGCGRSSGICVFLCIVTFRGSWRQDRAGLVLLSVTFFCGFVSARVHGVAGGFGARLGDLLGLGGRSASLTIRSPVEV